MTPPIDLAVLIPMHTVTLTGGSFSGQTAKLHDTPPIIKLPLPFLNGGQIVVAVYALRSVSEYHHVENRRYDIEEWLNETGGG